MFLLLYAAPLLLPPPPLSSSTSGGGFPPLPPLLLHLGPLQLHVVGLTPADRVIRQLTRLLLQMLLVFNLNIPASGEVISSIVAD